MSERVPVYEGDLLSTIAQSLDSNVAVFEGMSLGQAEERKPKTKTRRRRRASALQRAQDGKTALMRQHDSKRSLAATKIQGFVRACRQRHNPYFEMYKAGASPIVIGRGGNPTSVRLAPPESGWRQRTSMEISERAREAGGGTTSSTTEEGQERAEMPRPDYETKTGSQEESDERAVAPSVLPPLTTSTKPATRGRALDAGSPSITGTGVARRSSKLQVGLTWLKKRATTAAASPAASPTSSPALSVPPPSPPPSSPPPPSPPPSPLPSPPPATATATEADPPLAHLRPGNQDLAPFEVASSTTTPLPLPDTPESRDDLNLQPSLDRRGRHRARVGHLISAPRDPTRGRRHLKLEEITGHLKKFRSIWWELSSGDRENALEREERKYGTGSATRNTGSPHMSPAALAGVCVPGLLGLTKLANTQQLVASMATFVDFLDVAGYGRVRYGSKSAANVSASSPTLVDRTTDKVCSVVLTNLESQHAEGLRNRMKECMEAKDLFSSTERLSEVAACMSLYNRLCDAPAFVLKSLVTVRSKHHVRERRGAIMANQGTLLSARSLGQLLMRILKYAERLVDGVTCWFQNEHHVHTIQVGAAVADALTASFMNGRSNDNQVAAMNTGVIKRCATFLACIHPKNRFDTPPLAKLELSLLRLLRGFGMGNGPKSSRPVTLLLVSTLVSNQGGVAGEGDGGALGYGASDEEDSEAIFSLPHHLEETLHSYDEYTASLVLATEQQATSDRLGGTTKIELSEQEKIDTEKQRITWELAIENYHVLVVVASFEHTGTVRRRHVSRFTPRFAGFVGRVEVSIDGHVEVVTFELPLHLRHGSSGETKARICDDIFLRAADKDLESQTTLLTPAGRNRHVLVAAALDHACRCALEQSWLDWAKKHKVAAYVFHGLVMLAETLGWAVTLAANATLVCFLEVDGIGVSYVAGGFVVDVFGRICAALLCFCGIIRLAHHMCVIEMVHARNFSVRQSWATVKRYGPSASATKTEKREGGESQRGCCSTIQSWSFYLSGRIIDPVFLLRIGTLGVGTMAVTTGDLSWLAILTIESLERYPSLRYPFAALWGRRRLIAAGLMSLFVIVYVFAVVAFMMLQDELVTPDGLRLCSGSLMACTLNFLTSGMFAGGLGEVVPVLWGMDSIVSYGGTLYAAFATCFFVVAILLGLVPFLGIILDGVFRQRDKVLRAGIIAESCFICGLDKRTLRHEGPGFLPHVYTEHNVWDYLCFIAKALTLDPEQGPGEAGDGVTVGWRLAGHVRSLIARRDYSFLPDGESLSVVLWDEERLAVAEEERQANIREITSALEKSLASRLEALDDKVNKGQLGQDELLREIRTKQEAAEWVDRSRMAFLETNAVRQNNARNGHADASSVGGTDPTLALEKVEEGAEPQQPEGDVNNAVSSGGEQLQENDSDPNGDARFARTLLSGGRMRRTNKTKERRGARTPGQPLPGSVVAHALQQSREHTS